MMANASPDDLNRQVRAAAAAASASGATVSTAAATDRARYVLSASAQLKDEGNALFKAGKHSEALAKYERAISNVGSSEVSSVAALLSEARALRRACLLNSAAAALGAESWAKAIEAATVALAEDPGNAKALFRRGMARAGEAKSKKEKKEGEEEEALAAAAADLRAAASAAKGTADEPTIKEKLSEVEGSLKECAASGASPSTSSPSSSTSAAEAAVEAAAARVKAQDAARRAEAEKNEAEEKKKAAAAAAASAPASNPFAPAGGLSGGTPDPAQLRAMARAMRADPSLGEKMSAAARAMTPEQLRAAAAAQGLPAEAQATLSPDALSAAGTAMAAMRPEDLERMADAVEASSAAGGGGAGAGGASAAVSGLFGGAGGAAGAGSSAPFDPAAAAAAMLKDPAALRQATAMVKGLRPEQLAALSGGKIDAAQAEKLVKTLDGMSEEKIAMMLSASARFADWIRRAKEVKEKFLTRPVLVALAVVVVGVLMKRAGWF